MVLVERCAPPTGPGSPTKPARKTNPAFRDSVRTVLDRALHGKETANYELAIMTKSGDKLDILTNATTRESEAELDQIPKNVESGEGRERARN